WSVSEDKIAPLSVVWIHGYRDSAPDFLMSKGTNTKGNQSVGRDPHSGHSVSRRRGLLTESGKGARRTCSKVVVANHNHVGVIYPWSAGASRSTRDRRISQTRFMCGRANGGTTTQS